MRGSVALLLGWAELRVRRRMEEEMVEEVEVAIEARKMEAVAMR